MKENQRIERSMIDSFPNIIVQNNAPRLDGLLNFSQMVAGSIQPIPQGVEKDGVILVVDDMIPNLKLMKALLTPLNYQVLTDDSGPKALQTLQSTEVDLVLLDVMMPRMDGYEVCRQIKSNDHTRTIPVVLVTALDDTDSKVKGIEAGADDFITKPPNRSELVARTKSLIKVRRINKNLASIESVLFSLAAAIDAKDPYTHGHLERVANLSLSVGRHLNLPKNEIEALRFASILHDIGKIGVPDAILNKPGPLDPKEWELMKTHTDVGYRICHPLLNTLGKALQGIRHHHEKLDGSGYPDGLKGEEISLVARIMAVVDIYDALVSDRPYRKGMAMEKAFEILMKEAAIGKLDAKAVDVLLYLVFSSRSLTVNP
jgi:putative two-component system response regulator